MLIESSNVIAPRWRDIALDAVFIEKTVTGISRRTFDAGAAVE
jgi:hypothetical protein